MVVVFLADLAAYQGQVSTIEGLGVSKVETLDPIQTQAKHSLQNNKLRNAETID